MSAGPKNCHSCKHMEWVDGECQYGSNTGWTCNKRQANTVGAEDAAILAQIESQDYRLRYKRCYEPK